MVSSGSIGMLILLVGAVTGRAGLHSNLQDIPLFLPDEEELAAFESPGHETNRKPRSARPETFADYFKKLQLVQSELTKNASVGEAEIAEVFKRHGLATGNTPNDPNNNGTETQNATSTQVSDEHSLITGNRSDNETENLNLTSKDVFKIQGSMTENWACEDFKINTTTPLTETYKTQGKTTGNRTFVAPNANGTSAEALRTGNKTVEVYFVNTTETEIEAFKKKCSISGTSTSEIPVANFTTPKTTTPVTVITPFLSTTASTNQFSSGTWWGVSKRRNNGLHKALKDSSFLEEAFKGRSTILNSQMNRRKLK